MYHSFLIHLFTDGHLGCFQHFTIVNCAAVNIGVHRFFWIDVSGVLGYNPSSGIARLKAVPFSVFWGYSILFSTVVAPVYIPTNNALGFPFPTTSPTLVDLSMMTVLTEVKWYLITVSVCISLMASDTEHLFICLWTLSMSSLEKCLFKSFAHFLSWLLVLLDWSCVLYIFWRSGPSMRYHWQICFPILLFLFFILMLFSLAMQKLVILMRSHLFILSFISLAFGDMSVRMLPLGMSEIFLPIILLAFLWCYDLYLSLLSTLNLFLCIVSVGDRFSIFCM